MWERLCAAALLYPTAARQKTSQRSFLTPLRTFLNFETPRMHEQSKFAAIWTQYGRSILVLCVLALFLHDIFGTHGYLAMRRTKSDIERVQSDINRLAKENAELSDEVKSLKPIPQNRIHRPRRTWPG